MKEWGRARREHSTFRTILIRFGNQYEAYVGPGNTSLRPPLNFEKVLGDMAALSHWMTPVPWGDTLRQVACDGAVPPRLAFPSGPYGATVTLMDQITYLLIELARHIAHALS